MIILTRLRLIYYVSWRSCSSISWFLLFIGGIITDVLTPTTWQWAKFFHRIICFALFSIKPNRAVFVDIFTFVATRGLLHINTRDRAGTSHVWWTPVAGMGMRWLQQINRIQMSNGAVIKKPATVLVNYYNSREDICWNFNVLWRPINTCFLQVDRVTHTIPPRLST